MDFAFAILATAPLSPLDAVVVMGHDVESSSRNLMAALASDAGYIGAMGSRRTTERRAERLREEGVTDEDLARRAARGDRARNACERPPAARERGRARCAGAFSPGPEARTRACVDY